MAFPKILFISSDSDHDTVIEELKTLLDAGLQWYQLRMKSTPNDEILNTALVCKQLCADYNCLFTINDSHVLTKQVDADGVHLGKKDLDPAKAREILHESQHIGLTCNVMDDVMEAYKKKANYVGVGPYQFTSTKKNLAPVLGTDGYAAIISDGKYRKNVPIVAVGGLDLDAVRALQTVGVKHFAFSSYFTGENGIQNFKTILEHVG